jgi:diaminopimelate decarboxylase
MSSRRARAVSAIPGRADEFGHGPETIAGWRTLAGRALRAGARTPFYVFSAGPVAERVAELEALDLGRPATAWLSCKTQPLPALLRWWQNRGRPIEVVSEFEFRAALAAGFDPDRILVNGPAKQRWLPDVAVPGIRVHFDSPAELAALLPLARRQGWWTGLRVRTAGETDPEDASVPTQFGFEPDELPDALRRLNRAGIKARSAHFHLRTNVPAPSAYADALADLARICNAVAWMPEVVDVGGGLPPRHTLDRAGNPCDAGHGGTLDGYAGALRAATAWFPKLAEWWHENGRFVSAGSGVLVVRVLDSRRRRGLRQLVCDGGRTTNALVSLWELHALHPLEPRAGRREATAVHGPTCMAFDRLAKRPMPASIVPGDHLLWFEAGAYHLPWETRFSHGHAEIWWNDPDGPSDSPGKGRLARVRAAGTFGEFWSAHAPAPGVSET